MDRWVTQQNADEIFDRIRKVLAPGFVFTSWSSSGFLGPRPECRLRGIDFDGSTAVIRFTGHDTGDAVQEYPLPVLYEDEESVHHPLPGNARVKVSVHFNTVTITLSASGAEVVYLFVAHKSVPAA
jgi:hypothetical protein